MASGFTQRVNRVLGATLGVEVKRAAEGGHQAVTDLTSSGVDPLEAYYLLPQRPRLVGVPTSKCRAFQPIGFRCERNTRSPFVDTAVAYLESGHDQYEGSALQEYYERWSPSSIGEVVGVDDGGGPLSSGHQDGWYFPWHNAETRAFFASDRDKGIGRSEWGPVTASRGEMELKRIVALCDSLREHGFDTSGRHGFIGRSEILASGSDYAVLVSGGQHRASVLGALENGTVPVCFAEGSRPRFWAELVQRDHVDSWPSVKDGSYSVASALEVFDRMFAGGQPFTQPPR